MAKARLNWQPLERKSIFSTRVFDVHEIKSRSPENTVGTYFTLHAASWVIVVPVLTSERDEDQFLMVRQWRHGAERESVEFPGGVIDPGEKPEAAAARELLEETGYRAGKLTLCAAISPNPAIMDNQCHIFLAEELENTQQTDLDDDEFLTAEPMPVSQVLDRMGKGAYIHALMLSALFLYLQAKGKLPA